MNVHMRDRVGLVSDTDELLPGCPCALFSQLSLRLTLHSHFSVSNGVVVSWGCAVFLF